MLHSDVLQLGGLIRSRLLPVGRLRVRLAMHRAMEATSGLGCVERLGGLRQDREQVTHDTEVDQLQDGSLRVLVDRDDRLGH